MTSQTNEMDGSYLPAAPTADDIEVTLPSDAVTVDDASPKDEINTDVTVSDPVSNHDLKPESVYVYANTITAVSSVPDDTIVSFDVVFSVSCTDSATGTTSVHQVVKRIGVDKMKMAHNAKMTTPISIVEAKAPTKSPMGLSADRLKALAGIK